MLKRGGINVENSFQQAAKRGNLKYIKTYVASYGKGMSQYNFVHAIKLALEYGHTDIVFQLYEYTANYEPQDAELQEEFAHINKLVAALGIPAAANLCRKPGAPTVP